MGNYVYKYFFLKKASFKKSLKRASSENAIKETNELKRFRSTFDYLYQKLFIEGEGSDITINALSKTWKLHKLYLNQSPFFASMFSGGWLEKDSNEITLEFTDSNITSKGLDIIFGSFYYDSFELKEANVISVLASSIWFQLEDFRILCEDFILKNLSLENVVCFYEIGNVYEIKTLTNKCIEWLCSIILLVDNCEVFYSILKSISPNLMLEIIKFPKLFVVQIEQDVLLLLLKWLYLKIHPQFEQLDRDFTGLVYSYFQSQDNKSFQFPEELSNVIDNLFEAIRWEQVISSFNAASSLSRFSIIPQNILLSAYKNQWMVMLKSSEYKTGTISINVEEDLFWEKSERCGRKLINDVTTTWRWSTSKHGMDVVIRYVNREIYVIRYIDRQNCPDWMRHVPEKRPVHIHFIVSSYCVKKRDTNSFYPVITNRIESGIMTLELMENFPVKVMSVPFKFEFPLILSVNILKYNPSELKPRSDSFYPAQSNQPFDDYLDHIFPV